MKLFNFKTVVNPITGVVLAGGQGRRMGLTDKGLVVLHGKPMVAHVLERFAPQVGEVLVNANQNLEQYAAFGYSVISDSLTGYAGPLAGLQAGLSAAQHELVATVPCDSPFLPLDLIARLKAALTENQSQLAVAVTHQQPHPVFCLCRRDVLPHLTAFLDNGGRKIDAWYATLKTVEVDFSDEADAFININTMQELKSAK
ncbi:MAG: molybdenum cofactor guanylyltransferase MobA [Methylophilaceae bacterium]